MKLSLREKSAYGIGAVGKDIVYSLVAGFLMYYYNTILGISATFIGVLFMAARVFDAFSDPFMGIMVEKTHTPIGKFRPWLIVGTLINAGILIYMFSIPETMTGTTLLVVSSAAYIFWGISYTIMDVPYWSMIPAITTPGKDRENISVIARSCAGLGFAFPVALTMVLVPLLGSGSERVGFSKLSIIVAAIFIVFIGITVLNVKEKVKLKEKSPTIKEMLTAIMKNDQALIVVIAIVMFNASLYITQQLAIYYFKYDIGNAALFGIFGTVGGLSQIISMMLVPLFRKKLSSKKLLVAAISTALAGYALLFVLGAFNIKNIIMLCIAAIIIFMGFGVATVLTTIFLADTVDYGEWKNGHRSESVVFSLQIFVVKLGSAISVLIAGVGLDVIKLDINAVVQTDATLLGLQVLMLGFPMVGLVASILYFTKHYKLDDAKLDAITADLKNRRAEKAL